MYWDKLTDSLALRFCFEELFNHVNGHINRWKVLKEQFVFFMYLVDYGFVTESLGAKNTH